MIRSIRTRGRDQSAGAGVNLFLTALTLVLAVIGLSDVALAQFGTGADGPMVIGGSVTLTGNRNYTDLTVGPGAILNTAGYSVYVNGTLLNQGTITDNQSGGNGGGPGVAGAPGSGHSPYVNATVGGAGMVGAPGALPGSGSGGTGGTGGSGGAGAYDAFNSRFAAGGVGGIGGFGGKGGGLVKIYANNFDNQGVIHADGQSGTNGFIGSQGGFNSYTELVFFTVDMAGGGGGGGGGGQGGHGGRVEIYYGSMINPGSLHAIGGPGGSGAPGGLGRNQSQTAGTNQVEVGTTPPAGNGGTGGYSEVGTTPSGTGGTGLAGQFGSFGTISIVQVSCCIGLTGNVNKSVGETPDISDLSLLIAYLVAAPQPVLACLPEANINAVGGATPDISDLSLLIAYLTAAPPPVLPSCP